MPSKCERFGIEATSRGLPVIVAVGTSLPEVAGGAGILVAPGDVAGFAFAITEVLREDALRRDPSTRAANRAGQLTWDAAALILRDAVLAVAA